MVERPSPTRGWRPVLVVFLVAVALRLYGLDQWSLWEDEETTIYFSYHPGRSFPSNFPTFFLLLGHVFSYTGCSVLVGRLLSAVIGLASLALTYGVARRFAGQGVALTALSLLAISPAHLFWSQSIRYYGLVISLQLVSIWLFLEGLNRQRPLLTALSVVPLALAMTCHVSAVLLVPVLLAYLVWLAWRRGRTRHLWIAVACFLAGIAYVIVRWAEMLTSLFSGSHWVVDSARKPVHVLITALFYFGPPAIVLAIVGGWRQRASQRDEGIFFLLLAALPVGMLLALAYLNIINVTYYYGLIALVGVVVLAGYGVEAAQSWPPRLRLAGLIGVSLSYLAFLGAYFGPAHGDRPRWRDAATHIAAERSAPPDITAIYAKVPGVIAFYLGVPPDQTMGHPMVRPWSAGWKSESGVSGWFVAEERLVTRDEQARLELRCSVSARFPSRMLVRDRTVVVYRCPTP